MTIFAMAVWSRAIMPELRQRYARVLSILVTAPESMLKQRLNRRARESDDAVAKRLSRNDHYTDFEADHVIETMGTPAQSLEAFLTILRNR